MNPVSFIASGSVTYLATASGRGQQQARLITSPSTSLAMEYPQELPGWYDRGTDDIL